MKFAGTLLAVSLLALFLAPVSAEPGARVGAIDGSLYAMYPGDSWPYVVQPGQKIPIGSRLTARKDCTASLEVGSLGTLKLTGPASATLERVDGVLSVRVHKGSATFDYKGGKVLLVNEAGKFEVTGVAGYSGVVPAGGKVQVSGKRIAARVEMLSGGMMLSATTDHVRLDEGEAVSLPLPVRYGREGRTVRLRSREGEIELPPEAVLGLKGATNPGLDELERDWTQKRESPRIP